MHQSAFKFAGQPTLLFICSRLKLPFCPLLFGDTLLIPIICGIQVFSERRGQWKAATQSQEFLRTLQRYYNNAYMDADKQDAINM